MLLFTFEENVYSHIHTFSLLHIINLMDKILHRNISQSYQEILMIFQSPRESPFFMRLQAKTFPLNNGRNCGKPDPFFHFLNYVKETTPAQELLYLFKYQFANLLIVSKVSALITRTKSYFIFIKTFLRRPYLLVRSIRRSLLYVSSSLF